MNRGAKLDILIVIMTIIMIFFYEIVFAKGNEVGSLRECLTSDLQPL